MFRLRKITFIYRSIWSVVFSGLILGCGGEIKPELETVDEVWATQLTVCAQSSEEADQNAQKSLVQRVSTLHLQKNVKLSPSIKKEQWCTTAYISQKDWMNYSDVIAKKQQLLQREFQELNNTVAFQKKEQAITSWVVKAENFNVERDEAQKIANTGVSSLDTNKTVLLNAVNARPSLFVIYRPCDRNSNYRCPVIFTSKASDESKLNYGWDFGDGQHSSKQNPIHRYSNEGEYSVQVKVRDQYDVLNTVKLIVLVKRLSQPVAAFTFKNKSYKVGEVVRFRTVSYTQKGRIKSYRWHLGDGGKSSALTVDHRYKKAGKYNVSLRVCTTNKMCKTKKRVVRIINDVQILNLKKGSRIDAYIKTHKVAEKVIEKKKSLMSAYKFGDVWLLVKRGKIECAVTTKGLSLNLLGQPKKCYWHEKHAKRHMLQLKE